MTNKWQRIAIGATAGLALATAVVVANAHDQSVLRAQEIERSNETIASNHVAYVEMLEANEWRAFAPEIFEDDERWDCHTMGNHICGPIAGN